MKKRMGLLTLTMMLVISGFQVKASEEYPVVKYFNFILNDITAGQQDESLSDLIAGMEELVKDVKPEYAKRLIDFMKEQILSGKWDSQDGIQDAITQGEKEFNITLTEEQRDQILSIVKKIKQLGISPEYVLGQIDKIYEKYGEELKNAGKDIMKETTNQIREEVKKSFTDYFSDMVENVKLFFKGIFNR